MRAGSIIVAFDILSHGAQEAANRQRAEQWLAEHPKAAAMYEALSEEDKAKADDARGKPAAENGEALWEAAGDGQTAEVRVLLAAGTDPDAADGVGWTGLIRAAMQGHERTTNVEPLICAPVRTRGYPSHASASCTTVLPQFQMGPEAR